MSGQEPLWYKNAVFYQVSVRAFCDSNGDGHGDLPGLTSKLDYLQELGVTCVWLMPSYPSPLRDDGYDIADYYGILPEYGTLDDFRALIEQAHARGIRVIIDLVLNHTSDQHPWFQAARADPNSPYRDYYVWSDTDQKYAQARIIFVDTETSNWAWDDVAGLYYWHRFYASQPDLNYDNPAVRQEMLNILKFWLELGVDGFRADAVPYLFEREGATCENLPETHAFLKEMRRFISTHYPGRILLAEANQWPEDLYHYFGDGDEFHMGFHFPIMPRMFMALRQADRTPLVNILNRTPVIPESCQWCIFLRNHDELTLEMVTPEEREWMWQEYAPDPRMRLNLGIRRRLTPLLDNDRRQIELVHSLLFTLPGSPIIYYGDEIGMGDNIWLPDRNGVRTPMQWAAGSTGGFSTAAPEALYTPVIEDPSYSPARVNVAAQRADPSSLWNRLRRMIAVRQQHAAFGWGNFEWIECESTALAAYRRVQGDVRLLALHNLSAEIQPAVLRVPQPHLKHPIDILAGGDTRPIQNDQLLLVLKPYEYRWLKV
ncbi:MAG TPA: maltose alpha-D-glucosyltransferase [Anaerolineae bacterium]|nr:maltose alpha-D-glucosyltransferase [Anaerolineae bacterium]